MRRRIPRLCLAVAALWLLIVPMFALGVIIAVAGLVLDCLDAVFDALDRRMRSLLVWTRREGRDIATKLAARKKAANAP